MRRTLFDDDHELFRASVRAFIDKEIVPHVDEWEAAGIRRASCSPRRASRASSAWTCRRSTAAAGCDDFRYNVVIGEEMQRAGDGGAGLGIALHNDICLPYFLTLCTEEQKQRWLPGICSGELITAIAMTEPGIGSDLASMTTTRRPRRRRLRRQRRRRRSSPTASTPTS